jgi:hypothetical protein
MRNQCQSQRYQYQNLDIAEWTESAFKYDCVSTSKDLNGSRKY